MSQALKETFPIQTEREIDRKTIAAELTEQIRLAGYNFSTGNQTEAYAHQAVGQEIVETLHHMGYELEVSIPDGAPMFDNFQIEPDVRQFRARWFYFVSDNLEFENAEQRLRIANQPVRIQVVEQESL